MNINGLICANVSKINLSLIEFNNLAPSQNSYYLVKTARQLLNILTKFHNYTKATAQGPRKRCHKSDCLQVYHGLLARNAVSSVQINAKAMIEHREIIINGFFKNNRNINNTRIAGNIIASMQLFE